MMSHELSLACQMRKVTSQVGYDNLQVVHFAQVASIGSIGSHLLLVGGNYVFVLRSDLTLPIYPLLEISL